ncbi:MAG: plasmid mobilization relaxosome protein MobC [Alcaligenaceae bacterium]|nr:MAG: plasmid mobilization relaxosome protein MobC [Alcaligenaceae bacterium]
MEKTDKKTNTRYKNPEEKRTERMKIAVNPEEKNQLILNAEKLNYSSLAEFIRDTGLKNIDEMIIKAHKKESIEIIFQLKKIGANINQITKYCNANKKPTTKFITLVTEKLEKELTELKNILGKK